MITFSKLGNKGNLGNQLFQIASTIGIAEKYGHDYFFPNWNYSKYFKHKFPIFAKDESFEIVKEEDYKYYDWNLGVNNYDIEGWLQSEKYFSSDKIKEYFKFETFSHDLDSKYNFLFSRKTILVSIRRGDFVRHPYYYQLSHLFYFKGIINNFPDWQERNIIFTSDDIAYCKYHYSFLKNSFFFEDLSAIEQLALGSKCEDFVISNSTFSWWMAWLGEKEGSKIIRPIQNFRGEFAKKNNDDDYFPERWIRFDEKKIRLNISYWFFWIRGFIYEFLLDLKFIYKVNKKKIKNILKKKIN
ncbi:hypothetical protein OA88_03165 [Flavobacterium sp. JRM]|nr:hypothetical protein OA88_03165 [Flavobacterium sp. JRM]